jgi:hypothetical protein
MTKEELAITRTVNYIVKRIPFWCTFMPDNHKRHRVRLDDIADDTVEGARAIAEVLYDDDSIQSRKRVFYLAERGLIPVGRLGRRLIASRKKLREHVNSLTSGKA